MKKIFFSFGYFINVLAAFFAPLITLKTCYPSETPNFLDFIWYAFLVLCSCSYSVTFFCLLNNYDNLKNRLLNIINLNKKNDKNLNIVINNSEDIINDLIL